MLLDRNRLIIRTETLTKNTEEDLESRIDQSIENPTSQPPDRSLAGRPKIFFHAILVTLVLAFYCKSSSPSEQVKDIPLARLQIAERLSRFEEILNKD